MSETGKSLEPGERRFGVGLWVVIAVLVAAVVAGGAVLIARHTGGSQPVEIILQPDSSAAVEVYLSGAVDSEGIYTYSEDSTLGDVLRGAGGVVEGSDPLALRIYVVRTGESPFGQPDESEQGTEGTKININTASSEELQTLTGIGPVKAQAIIDYRNENGFFRSIDELLEVSGIGPKTLEKIRDQIAAVDW